MDLKDLNGFVGFLAVGDSNNHFLITFAKDNLFLNNVPTVKGLSKSCYTVFCQCPQNLWLKVYKPDEAEAAR